MALLNAGSIQDTAHDVVAYAGQVFHAATAEHNDECSCKLCPMPGI